VSKRVLIIDDEETILFGLQRFFLHRGFTVDCARELEEAEALITCYSYDFVIVDVSLTAQGSSEGLEVVRFVRRQRPAARLIVLTGSVAISIEAEAIRRGAHAFLRKPLPLSRIAQVAEQLIESMP
jgi:two-component system response regulator RegA